MTYDPARRRRRPIRLKEAAYTASGAYYATICVQDRVSRFGEVDDGEMRLNAAGAMVADPWRALAQRFPRVTSDAFHRHAESISTGSCSRATANRILTAIRHR